MNPIDRISGDVLDISIRIHRELGPGLLGLLINFGGATLKEGFQRLVNNYDPSASPRLCANQPA